MAANDWHHDACGCDLCEQDRRHLGEEVEVSSLADLAGLIQPMKERFVMPSSTSLISGIGSIALAIYHVTQGDLAGAIPLFLAGFAFLHGHQTAAAVTSQALPATPAK